MGDGYGPMLVAKTPITPTRDPWRDPRYKGKVEYSPDMCPQTLDILSRTVSVGLNQRLTEEHTPLDEDFLVRHVAQRGSDTKK